jgi:phage terminase large subunit GpA-like protein
VNYEPINITPEQAPWLPASILKRIELEGRVTFTGSFSAADKKIMHTRRQMKMSSWVEKNIVATSGPKPGPWQNRTTPYLADIMNAGMFKTVRTIIVCATPQTAKTSLGHNSIAYCIDRAPGDTLYIFPDENTAKENIRDRIIPMITASPQLKKYSTGAVDDMANIRIKLQHMAIYAAWASSATRLANKPIRYVVFDEIDKYPEVADKRETDPISLGEKRVQTFRRMGKEKIWKLSTPTIESGPIWQALTKEAQYRFDCWVRCPHCDELQLMSFPQIKWPREGQKSEVSGQKSEVSGQGAENSPLERGGREADGVCRSKDEHPDPETVTSQKLAWYECPHCGSHWNDDQRDQAVRMSVWKEHETGTEHLACL